MYCLHVARHNTTLQTDGLAYCRRQTSKLAAETRWLVKANCPSNSFAGRVNRYEPLFASAGVCILAPAESKAKTTSSALPRAIAAEDDKVRILAACRIPGNAKDCRAARIRRQ